MTFQSSNHESLENRVAAAAKVFDEHGGFIRVVVSLHVQDKHLADDLYQDFFLSLISRPLPEGLENIKGYLYRTITNDVVDATRRIMKYRDYMCKHAECSKHPDRQKTPQETLQEVEDVEMALKLIKKRLPCTQAEAVSLRYLDSQKVKEIAKTMGVANATARAYVHDAIVRICELWGEIETQTTE